MRRLLAPLLLLAPIPAGAAPNLTATVDHAVTCVSPGDDLLARVRVSNRGADEACGVAFRVLYSDDDLLDGSDVELYLESQTICIPANQGRTSIFPVPLGASVPVPAIGRLLVEADPGGGIEETDETDNVGASAPLRIDTRADLVITSASIVLDDGCVFGHPAAATVELRNTGCADAHGFVTELRLGAGGDAAPVVVGRSPPECLAAADCVDAIGPSAYCDGGICTADCATGDDCGGPAPACVAGKCTNTLAAGGSATVSIEGVLPDGEPDGPRSLLAVVDGLSIVPEIDETDDELDPLGELACSAPYADLDVAQVQVAPQGVAGEQLLVRRAITNRGFAPAAFAITYLLSEDAVADAADVPLDPVHGEVLALDPGRSDDRSLYVLVPTAVPEGTYRLLAVADPGAAVPELSEANNARTSDGAVDLRPASLRVVSDVLPEAMVSVPYQLQLSAQGGAGAYSWTASALAPGLVLSDGGVLVGRPTRAGSFTMKVTVASGNATASADVRLVVLPYTPLLAIATDALPQAFVGQAYGVELDARGGFPPYAWSLQAPPPDGLGLVEDRLLGAPETVGCSPVALRVTDTHGASADRELRLCVVQAPLRLSNTRLPDGTVGQAYDDRLEAEGGLPPYRFAALGLEGTGLAVEPGTGTTARIAGVPSKAGTPAVTLRVTDEAGFEDELRVSLVIRGRNLVVTPMDLPDVRAGDAYPASRLAADAQATWDLQAGALPPGLTLSADGVIAGTVPRSATPGAYAFAVRASDAVGDEGLGAFSITVLPASRGAASGGEGCCSGGGAEAVALPGLALALLRPRRRREA